MDLLLKKRLGIQLRRYLFGSAPSKNISKLICLPKEKLKEYLQAQFVDGMTWENYAQDWHIDHIVPLDVFADNEIELAWHFLNLRPEKIHLNKCKGASLAESREILDGMIRAKENPILISLRNKANELKKTDFNFLLSFI